jgi:hypothetical protein
MELAARASYHHMYIYRKEEHVRIQEGRALSFSTRKESACVWLAGQHTVLSNELPTQTKPIAGGCRAKEITALLVVVAAATATR